MSVKKLTSSQKKLCTGFLENVHGLPEYLIESFTKVAIQNDSKKSKFFMVIQKVDRMTRGRRNLRA
jgi:hypothetical protein